MGSQTPAKGPKLLTFGGDTQQGKLTGTFIKLPAGFSGKIVSHGSTFRAVVIKGFPRYKMSQTDVKTLEPGSYFSSDSESAVHQVSSKAEEESIIYVRTDGMYDVISAPAKK